MGLYDTPFDIDSPEPSDTSAPVSRKDHVLSEITRLKQRRVELLTEHESSLAEKLEAEKIHDEVEKKYEEIKRQLEAAAADLRTKARKVNDVIGEGKRTKEAIDQLERELGRILDKESIDAKYLAQIQEFKERCLDAIWRSENREDGRGAFNYQIEGAINLAVAGQALLGDKRGLGKTLTSLIFCDLVEAQRIIAIVPSDTMDNFIRELKLWAPHRAPVKLGGMPKKQRDFVLSVLKNAPQFTLVVNYEAWRRDDQLIPDLIALNADTLLLDEAHRQKEMKSHISKGVQTLRFGGNICPNCDEPDIVVDTNAQGFIENWAECKNCKHKGKVLQFCSIKNVLPMTGTPILNRPQELFPQLKLIDIDNFWDVDNFLRDFCYRNATGYWVWGWGAEDKLIKMIGPRYVARDRKSAGVVIPPASPVDHILTKDEMRERYPQQWRAYEQCRKYAQIVFNAESDDKKAVSVPAWITVLMRLRQVLTWPAQIRLQHKDPETGETVFDEFLDVYESIKLDKAEELIKEINSEGDRVVLFSQFKGPLNELKRRLGDRTAIYNGDVASHIRNQIQLDFDVKTAPINPCWDNVLCNYKAAGEGLNLNSATHLILLDREWNPGRESQAEGRIDRLGQTKDTYIHNIMVEPSVDVWMAQLIGMKKDMIGGFEDKAELFQQMRDALLKGEM